MEAFAVPFALSLVFLCVFERTTNALLCLLFRTSDWKQSAAHQVVVRQLELLSGVLSIFTTTFVRVVFQLLGWWALFATAFVVMSMFYVTYEEYPEVWVGLSNFYNANVGPWVGSSLLAPLRLVDVLIRGLVPLWNAWWWWVKTMVTRGLLPIALDEIQILLQMATTVLDFGASVAISIGSMVSSFDCVGDACLVPESRVLDVLSPLSHVRQFVALGAGMFNAFCGALAAPFDLLIFPLLDLNFAQGVHCLFNSLAQLFVVVPHVTYERCRLAQNNTFGALMCTPDFEPVFNFLVAGVSSLGLSVDNWLNVALVVTQKALTGSAPTCDTTAALEPHLIMAQAGVFGANATAVVGLTEWMYAVTDGYTAIYSGHDDSSARVQVWPYAMDASFGVAAVTYSQVGDIDASSMSKGRTVGSMQTTSMLACNCSDVEGGIIILCAILPMAGLTPGATRSNYLLQALFPDELTPSLIGACASVDVVVRSVRWPATRFETRTVSVGGDSTTLSSGDCMMRGTCREVDATLFVVPRCGADDRGGCNSQCFPFCMAVRYAGSANNNLLLAGAYRWRTSYSVASQDCTIHSSTVDNAQTNLGRTGTKSVVQSPTMGGSGVVVSGSDVPQCRPAQRILSLRPKSDKPTQRSAVRLVAQPLFVAGDVVFTERVLGGGASSVVVERLTSNERGSLSLVTLNQDLPAAPKLEVQADERKHVDAGHVLIPFSYYVGSTQAVSSRNFVFYAVPPALDCFQAYFEYCYNKEHNSQNLPRAGFLLMSSYAPIRVYRVAAYRQCKAFSCGNDLVRFVEFEGIHTAYMSARCNQTFNASIASMEYLNEDNIAIIMQVSKDGEYDVVTNKGEGPNSYYKTYWLNPATMRVKGEIWQTNVPTSRYGVLCPAMQRLPRVGTFGAELINSVVFLLKFVVGALVYTPGMGKVWTAGGMCPEAGASRRHSVLTSCGEDLFSLDDFFDSLEDANAVFWYSLTNLATLTNPDHTANPITDVLEGMAQYGEGTIDLWEVRNTVLTLSKVPIKEQGEKLFASMVQSMPSMESLSGIGSMSKSQLAAGAGSMYLSMFRLNVGAVAWARFVYKVVSEVALVIAKASLARDTSLTEAKVWQYVWGTLYDLKAYYTATIADRNRMGCAGLRTMFGTFNPWAQTIYYGCTSAAALSEDLFALALNIAVEIPLVKCVCKDSKGLNARAYVQEICTPNLPVSLRPRVYMMVNMIQGGTSKRFTDLACAKVVSDLKYSLQHGMDRFLEQQFAGTSALAGVVDYMLATFDKSAGKCVDFAGDPHVVVMVPEPVDYFSMCARTSMCKAKCASVWAAFQQTNTTPVQLPDITTTMESLFFPGEYDDSMILINAVAATEVTGVGACIAHAHPDLAVAVAELMGTSLKVEVYCVPQAPGDSLYRAMTGAIGPFPLPGDLLRAVFRTGTELGVLVRVGDVNTVYLLTSAGLSPLPPVPVPKNRVLLQLTGLWAVQGGLVVDAVTRGFDGDTPIGEMLNYRLAPNATRWASSPIDLSQFEGTYWFIELSSGESLLLPQIAGQPGYTLMIDVGRTGTLAINYISATTSLDLVPFQAGLRGAVLACQSLHTGRIFVVAPKGWDWLQQLRVDGTAVLAYNSIPVTATLMMRGHCDAESCEGCRDLATHRLCEAYSQCALVNCVGTPVNQKRPLCGLGGALKSAGDMALTGFQAAWVMMSELLSTTIELSVRKVPGVDIAFPDDAFVSAMCVAKDGPAQFFSILTSAINNMLQLGQANVRYMYLGASNVDTNADAMLTQTMTAINKFLSQLALYPLYNMASTYQILICQINGALKIVDASGFTVRLMSADLASGTDAIAGKCLTMGESQLARYPSGQEVGVGGALTKTLQTALQRKMVQTIEPMVHYLDAMLAWGQGAIHELGVLVMSQSVSLCSPPDHYLSDVVTCACGDTRLAIPIDTRNNADHALWCTGTLGMVDGSNQPLVVYNMYTYAQLQAKASGMQRYVDCASQSYSCSSPQDDELEYQGVTVLNVLVKCRENYVKRQWDPMAYVAYDKTQWHRFKTKRYRPTLPKQDPHLAYQCLNESAANGMTNAGCLESYLLGEGIPVEEYWRYERLVDGSGPQYTDACMTFTGPAAKGIEMFKNCVDDNNYGTCTLSSHIWSPASANAIPVGYEHVVEYRGQMPDSLIFRLYERAQAMVMKAVTDALTRWQVDQKAVEAQFFSAEGDVIHQILDCIFLGPYARVDYWPIPPCDGTEDCPNGPYWARDEAGTSRNLDPYDCVQEPSLPYTCGSPGRQSLVRFFVKRYLSQGNGNSSVFQQAVKARLEEIKRKWESTTNFGCNCQDGIRSHTCCKDAQGRFFPPELDLDLSALPSEHVLEAITSQFQDVYTLALQTQAPWIDHLHSLFPGEFATWDWTASRRAVDEARFDPKNPVYNYSGAEANSPMDDVDSTLWDICHSTLKQVFFTMPIQKNGTLVFGAERAADGSITSDPLSFDALPYDGDPSRLEDYIAALLRQSLRHNPLHRHYPARHAPSESLLCEQDFPHVEDEGVLRFETYTHTTPDHTVRILEGDTLGTFPVYHPLRFALGERSPCYCGWAKDSTGLCILPDTVCESLGLGECRMAPGETPGMWADDWPCPEFEPSAHWGIMDPGTADSWLGTNATALQTPAGEVLRYGRGGLRVGSAEAWRGHAKRWVNPTNRTTPKENAKITTCPGADPEKMVNNLFPMSQGVEEAGAVAYCLRYVLETARSAALNLTDPEGFEATNQAGVVATWRGRCGAQLQLIHLCEGLDVYHAPDPLSHYIKTCPHFAPSAMERFYTTPECLVRLDGAWYDPCRCMACVGNPKTVLDQGFLKQTSACRIRYDPANMLNPGPIGYWPSDVGAELNAIRMDPALLLSDSFAEEVLGAPVGNVPSGETWWGAEGPMADSALHCDMIADYWPDEWDFPVGYHVTVPCEEPAWRTFHQAFGLRNVSGEEVLAYQHDLLRDAGLVDSHFGVGGLCRGTNFGMDAVSTNLMRYCTRVPKGDLDATTNLYKGQREDYTVYNTPPTPTAWTNWVCTSTAEELPWPDHTMTQGRSSAEYSVGTLPNMPDNGANTYPATLDEMFEPGPWQEILRDNGWGRLCSDLALTTCTDTCPAGYTCRGRFCKSTGVACGANPGICDDCEGVCMEERVECIRHDECTDGKMCNGLGACVVPTVAVINEVADDDFAFQAFGQTCPAGSSPYSLLGASFWGYVTSDVLRAHGQCSYGDWFKYLETIRVCQPADRGTHFELDPTTCKYIDFDANLVNQSYWWAPEAQRPNYLYMHPHNCDRDYERLSGFVGCSPRLGATVRRAQVLLDLEFDQFVKMHSGVSPAQGGVRIPLAKMPYRDNQKYGFLGLSGNLTSDENVYRIFAPCSSIDQCTAPPFTHRGVSAIRKVSIEGGVQNYTDNDVFRCGAFGYLLEDKCHLDLGVLPLYRVLCTNHQSGAKCRPLVEGLSGLCEAVQEEYAPGFDAVASNTDALNALLTDAFARPENLDDYLDTMDCMIPLHAYTSSSLYTSFYYLYNFALYEVPFDWFYQCLVMAKFTINPANRGAQDCPAFQLKAQYSWKEYTPRTVSGDSGLTFLHTVRGGYRREDVEEYLLNGQKRVAEAVQGAINTIIRPMGNNDTTAPRCSGNLRWRIGKYGLPYNPALRSVIGTWYDQDSTCGTTWLNDQIDGLSNLGITAENWLESLTIEDPDDVFQQADWLPDSNLQTPTLLSEIKEFVRSSVKTALVDKVMGMYEAPSGVTSTTRSEGIMLDTSIPPAYTGWLVDENLDPGGDEVGETVELSNAGVAHTCVFDRMEDDPRVSQYASNCITVNNSQIKRCGNVECTHVPVLYERNGRYRCRFPLSLLQLDPCNASNAGCGMAVLNYLYDRVKQGYTPPSKEPLAAKDLPWMQNTWAFTFKPAEVLDYLGNIMPDVTKPIMCTVNTKSLVDLMNCTNPHYEALKAHAKEHYLHDGPPLVPRQAQLDWPVDSAFLTQGAVFAYASTARPARQAFFKSLLDDSFVCTGETTGDLRVCWQKDTEWRSINPWTLGYWNPFEECDVDYLDQSQGGDEYIDAECNEQVCPNNGGYYNNMPFRSACKTNYRKKVLTPGVPPADAGEFLPYNLCHHQLEEDQVGCLHDQGLLGGMDGLSVGASSDSQPMTWGTKYSGLKYNVASNMYSNSTWELPDDYRSGLFGGANPLWQGLDGVFGHLRVPPTEIGVHRLGFRVERLVNSKGFSRLVLERVPLSSLASDAGDLNSPGIQSRKVGEWVGTLLSRLEQDATQNDVLNSNTGSGARASCPLARFAFYSSNRSAFAPSMPSPQRAKHLFGNITGKRSAHPTMEHVADGRYLGKYRTSNGFCFCPYVQGVPQGKCQVLIGDSGDKCSLFQSVRALTGEYPLDSYVFHPKDGPCTMSLDWPNLPNSLRDATPTTGTFQGASDTISQQCHVLDRLQAFQYKYISKNQFLPNEGTSMSGACQTRRAATIPSNLPSGRCVRGLLSTTQSELLCEKTASPPVLPRRVPLTPAQMTARTKRMRCGECQRPPRFTTSAGQGIPPESSFGRPHRVSAERALRNDLRRAVCQPDCTRLLNESAWALGGEFMRNFLFSPGNLFSAPQPPKKPQSGTDDSPKWEDHGWVYCPDRAALSTGKGCLGSIPREVWRTRKTTVCPRMVKDLSSRGTEDPLARTAFCSVDSTLDTLCQVVTTAKKMIIDANCIAAGNLSCLPRPWVYHPATYDPSNQAWVYSTVLAYYRQVSQNLPDAACPLTSQESTLLAYNQNFMKSCPANSLVFFEKLVKILRVIVIEVALMVSTFFAMQLRLVTMLFMTLDQSYHETLVTAKAQIKGDWAYIKKEGKQMMSTVSDLFADMLFESGPIGAGLVDFMGRACTSINKAYDWFERKWCKWIQPGLTKFLTSLRKGLSMIASGFEILQDFMDEILGGILPAAMISKYGAASKFQTKLIEKYSQPMSRKKKTINKGVQSTVKKTAKSFSGVMKTGLKGLGVAGALLSIGFAAYDTYESVQGYMNYPDNFTLFDFSGVFDTIDGFMAYLSNEESCFEFSIRQQDPNSTYTRFTCFAYRLDNATGSTRGTTSLDPTVCWATANPSLGQSNLFACGPGSTCCTDNFCENLIACDLCPAATFKGDLRYGCEPMQKVCKCQVPQQAYTPCSKNAQCGSKAYCVLASFTTGVSYGTLPCGDCPSHNVYCLVQPTGFPAQCTCYTDSTTPMALCADTSGAPSTVDGARLCGYSSQASASTSNWQFWYDEIAMVPCAQAHTVVCSTIYVSQSTSLRISMAYATLRTSRRLMAEQTQEEEEFLAVLSLGGWNATAEPCRSLATIKKPSVLEDHQLRECAYWRFAGRAVLIDANLTHLMPKHENFLMSWEDLALTLKDPMAVVALLTHPQALFHALLFHPWTKPVRSLANSLTDIMQRVDWLQRWEEEPEENLIDLVTGQEEKKMVEDLYRLALLPNWKENTERLQNPGGRKLLSAEPGEGRKLLSVLTDIQAVKAFSAAVAQGDKSPPLSQTLADSWVRGPFVWPPQYDFSINTCPIGLAFYSITKEVTQVTTLYFINWNKPRPAIDRSFRHALPHINWHTPQNISTKNVTKRAKSWASATFHAVLDALKISPEDAKQFWVGSEPWTLRWIFETAVQCDLAAVVACSRHDRDLLMSVFVFLLFYAAILLVTSGLGVPGLSTYFLMGFPVFIIWYVYGVSFRCFPLLPPCLMDDIIHAVEVAFPTTIRYSPRVLCNASQANETFIDLDRACFTPCDQLYFETWADPIAFALCDLDHGWCMALSGLLRPYLPFMSDAFDSKNDLFRNATSQDLSAYRTCTLVTWITTIPFLAIVLSLVLSAFSILAGFLQLGPALVATIAQTIVFHRTPDRGG